MVACHRQAWHLSRPRLVRKRWFPNSAPETGTRCCRRSSQREQGYYTNGRDPGSWHLETSRASPPPARRLRLGRNVAEWLAVEIRKLRAPFAYTTDHTLQLGPRINTGDPEEGRGGELCCFRSSPPLCRSNLADIVGFCRSRVMSTGRPPSWRFTIYGPSSDSRTAPA